jgi:probable HAF family extracellular repeat protein
MSHSRYSLWPILTLAGVALVTACQDDEAGPTAVDEPSLAQTQATYTVKALVIPGNALLGEASDINDAGVIAGWYQVGNTWTAVRWTSPTQGQSLGKITGFQSALAKGINNAGTIVGYVANAFFSASRAFIWTPAGGMKLLQDLGGGGSIAFAINSSGVIVGEASTPNGEIHAVKWSPAGVITDINPAGGAGQATGINDAGDISGYVFPQFGNGEHVWLWRANGTQQDLGTLGGQRAFAYGINNNLIIVGESEQPPPKPDIAFRWSQATGMKPIGVFGGGSKALGISDRNRVVGFQIVNQGVIGLTVLNGVKTTLPDLGQKGFPFSGPTAVNLCGTVVGSSVSPSPTNGNSVPAVWTKVGCD